MATATLVKRSSLITPKLQALCARAAYDVAAKSPTLTVNQGVVSFAQSGNRPRDLSIWRQKAYLEEDAIGFWLGRTPKDGDMAEVIKVFVEASEVGPGIRKFATAVVGKGIDLNFSVNGKVLEKDDEVPTVMRAWANRVNFQSLVNQALTYALGLGNSYPYVYQTSLKRLNELLGVQVSQTPTSLEDALRRVNALALNGTQAGVIEDEHHQPLAYWYSYTVEVTDPALGTIRADPKLEIHTPFAQAIYSRNGLTLTLDQEATAALEPLNRNRLGDFEFQVKRIQLTGGALIGHALMDDQGKLSESMTYLQRNSQTGGYRSIVTVNAQESVNRETKEKLNWTLGPQKVIELLGKELWGPEEAGAVNPETKKRAPLAYSPVGLHFVDPIDPRYMKDTGDSFRLGILSRLDQLWTQNVISSNISGESQKESRTAFDARVRDYANLGRDIVVFYVKTALAMAGNLLGDAQRFQDVEVEPKFYLDVVSGDLALFQALINAKDTGYVAKRTVLEQNPAVYDVEAEEARLESEARQELASIALSEGAEQIAALLDQATQILVQLGEAENTARRLALFVVLNSRKALAAKALVPKPAEGEPGDEEPQE